MSNPKHEEDQSKDIEDGITKNDNENSENILTQGTQNRSNIQNQIEIQQEEENKKYQNFEKQDPKRYNNSEIQSQSQEKNSQSFLTDEQIAKENGGRDEHNENFDKSNLINYEYFDEFNRPRYEEIVNFENNLREEMEKNSPLVSEKLNIEILVAEYSDSIYQNSTFEFSKKIKQWRTVRRDGNCFYRSFLFRLFEEYILERNEKLHSKILKLIEESKNLCEDNGITWMVLEDFYNVKIIL
jgi:hypothetical protein